MIYRLTDSEIERIEQWFWYIDSESKATLEDKKIFEKIQLRKGLN